MKKIFMLATAALIFSGVAFSQNGNKKNAKCTKSSCKKGGDCCSDKSKATAKVKA